MITPARFVAYNGQQYAQAFFKQYYSSIAIKTMANVEYDHKDGTKLADFEGIVENESIQADLSFCIYLFHTVNEANKEEMLKGIKAYMDELNQYENNIYGFNVKFWDKIFLEGKDFDQLNFGFNVYNEDYIDDGDTERQYIKQGLGLELYSGQIKDITIDSLYSFMGPYENDLGYETRYLWVEAEDN